jgi:hypothetical protein
MIKEVAAGEKSLRAIFDKEQELFLAEMCRIRYDLDKLAMYGPVAVQWWRITHPGVPGHLTAELWRREDKKALLETSLRVPPRQAAFANAGFAAFLAEVGAMPDNAEQAKTRWALTGETPESRGSRKARHAGKKSKKAKHAAHGDKPELSAKKTPAKKAKPRAPAKAVAPSAPDGAATDTPAPAN